MSDDPLDCDEELDPSEPPENPNPLADGESEIRYPKSAVLEKQRVGGVPLGCLSTWALLLGLPLIFRDSPALAFSVGAMLVVVMGVYALAARRRRLAVGIGLGIGIIAGIAILLIGMCRSHTMAP